MIKYTVLDIVLWLGLLRFLAAVEMSSVTQISDLLLHSLPNTKRTKYTLQ